MRLVLCTFALLFVLPNTTHAQGPVSPEVKKAMAKLSFLEGKWEGTGTMTTGPNQKNDAKVLEVGSYKLQGTVFMVEGTGVAKMPDGSEKNVHDALGLISYDAKTNKYRMRTYRAGGEVLDPEITLKDQTIVWRFKDPTRGTKIRFTLTVKNNVWTEVGEANVDRDQWFKFFEMNLKRVKEKPKKG